MKHSPRSVLVLLVLLAAALTLHGADLLLEYSFNDSSPATETTARSLWDWPLAFQAQDGTPADWHGALGSGVAGLSADRAFDNSAATAMGTGGGGRTRLRRAPELHPAGFGELQRLVSDGG